jgi:hypothetical protein
LDLSPELRPELSLLWCLWWWLLLPLLSRLLSRLLLLPLSLLLLWWEPELESEDLWECSRLRELPSPPLP